MNKIIVSLLIFLLPFAAAAKTDSSVSVLYHHTKIKYDNSPQKEKGLAKGVYLYWGYGLNHSFEGAYDNTRLKYKGDGFFSGENLNQNDVTFLYTNYSRYSYRFMAGVHRITSNLDDNVLVLFGGINHYVVGKREFQLNFYYSRYRENDPLLSVAQLAPEYGALCLKGAYGSLYAKIKGYYIHLDKEVGLEKNDLYSIELNLTYYYKKLRIRGFGWSGEQSFAVREGGFVVYNLAEKHIGGYGVKVNHSLFSKTYLSFSCAREIFSDIYANVVSSASVWGLSVVYGF